MPEENASTPDPVEPRPDHTEVYRIIQKRNLGEDLTDAERQILRAYWKPYQKRKMTVHLPEAKADSWRKMADDKGLSDSEWIQQMARPRSWIGRPPRPASPSRALDPSSGGPGS